MPIKDDLAEPANTDLFERDLVRNYVWFSLRAVRRHRLLVAAVFASMVGAAVVGLWALPKTYRVETKLFAQRSQVLAVRGDGPDAVAPTRGAVEVIERTDNLVAVIQSTDLIAHYQAHRAPAERARDSVLRLLSRTVETEQDRMDAMLEVLEKRLSVWTSEGTVTVALEWPDAEMACRLVNAIQQNFLETRYAQEITALAEASAIVNSHAATLRADIDDAVATIEALRGEGSPPPKPSETDAAGGRSLVLVGRTPRAAPEPLPESRAAVTRAAKQRAYDDLEESRRRRLADVQGRLLEQRSMYTDNHPTVVESRQALAALATESPQARALAQEIAVLRAEAELARPEGEPDDDARKGPSYTLAPAASPRARSERPSVRLEDVLGEDRAPATVYARGRLRDAMDKYAALRAQLQSAEMDLQTAEAAFKYRYGVLVPAQMPRNPLKPSPLMVLLAASLAGALLSVLAALVADLRAGRLLERWQIERLLDRPILGELALPPGSRRAVP
jgi:hypothetical protein